MKNISNSIILILVSLVVLSCGGNKSGSSKKSKVDKTPPESKLNQVRNSFVDKELRPMKKEIELALQSLNSYREYEESVRSLEALPLVELKKVKNTFIAKHGSEAKEVKLKVSGLKSQISENKKELIKIRKDIQKNELVFNEKKSSVE